MTVTLERNVEEFLGTPRQLFINGQWADAASGRSFETPNPATGETLARVAEGEAEDIDRAVRAARRAFEEGPWGRMTTFQRGRIIWRIGDLINEHLDELAQLESLDNGKPVAVAPRRTCRWLPRFVPLHGRRATKLEGHTIRLSVPYTPGAKYHSVTLREPVGVVGQIIPWNFPLLMAAWKLGPALAVGNTVVLKPAEQTPLTRCGSRDSSRGGYSRRRGQYRDRLWRDRRAPRWPPTPTWTRSAFTGSTEVGKLIVNAAAGT